MIGWETRNDSRNENNNDCNQRMDRSKPKLQQRSKNTTSFNNGGRFLVYTHNSLNLRNRKKLSEVASSRRSVCWDSTPKTAREKKANAKNSARKKSALFYFSRALFSALRPGCFAHRYWISHSQKYESVVW